MKKTNQPMTAAQLNVALKKAKTLEKSHMLAVLLVQTLKNDYKGMKHSCYQSKVTA